MLHVTDCVIFDIDGTVANGSHRQVHLKDGKKDWKTYKALNHLDTRIHEVHHLYMKLVQHHHVVFVSGRTEDERDVTVEWLRDNHFFGYSDLFLREAYDYRDDSVVKEEILHNKVIPEYGKPLFVFEDRKRVKRMWVKNGIFVLDVNQHDEEF